MVRIISKSRRYVDELRSSISIKDKKDSHKIESLYTIRKKLIRKRNILNFYRVIFYVALYASIISSFTSIFNLLPFISKLVDFILTYTGILGTTFSFIMILILTHSIKNYDRDISTTDSHIIAIHVKHDKSDKEKFSGLMKKIK